MTQPTRLWPVPVIALYAVAKGHKRLLPMFTGYKRLPMSLSSPRHAPALLALLALAIGIAVVMLLAAYL